MARGISSMRPTFACDRLSLVSRRYVIGKDRPSAPLPARPALLPERAHSLAEVLGLEAHGAELHELALDGGVEPALGRQQLAQHALVARQRQRRVGRDLLRQ